MTFIIASPHQDAGLGNRVNCIINTLYISDKLNYPILINWKANWSCGAEFNDIFENDYKQAIKEELNDNNNIIIKSWKLPDISDEELFFYTKKLVFNKDLINKANEFVNRITNINNVIGLHIRGNGTLISREKNMTGFIDSFEKMIEEIVINKNNKWLCFYLATDDKSIEDKFFNKYENCSEYDFVYMFSYPKSDVDRNNLKSIKEAVIDLLVLSKFKLIIGSGKSSFSKLAWLLSNGKSKLKYVGSDEQVKVNMSIISYINQVLRRNSSLYRKGLNYMGYLG